MTDQEKARLEELRGKKDNLSVEEQAELASLEDKEKAAAAAAAGTGKGGKGGGKGGKSGKATDEPEPETAVTTSFDTDGASHVVTIRNGKAVKVWFRDGKEIGVEDVG